MREIESASTDPRKREPGKGGENQLSLFTVSRSERLAQLLRNHGWNEAISMLQAENSQKGDS